MEAENKILVDLGVKTIIKNEMKLGSYPTIQKALEGRAKTPKDLEIRKAALQLGGVEIENQNLNQRNNESTERN